MQRTGQGLSTPNVQHSQSASNYAGNLVELLGLDDEGATWRDSALCAQVDGDLFYPEEGGSTREAKKVCGGCEVQQQCLDYALTNGERWGIWGGLSERERRRLRPAAQQHRSTRMGRPPGTVQPINHGTEGGYAAHRRRKEQACETCLAGSREARARRVAERRGAA